MSARCEPQDPHPPQQRLLAGCRGAQCVNKAAAHDRAGLERLLRYCARPPFALERLELLDAERVVYRLPKPRRDGATALTLTPPWV